MNKKKGPRICDRLEFLLVEPYISISVFRSGIYHDCFRRGDQDGCRTCLS